jgi:hypothetical protein
MVRGVVRMYMRSSLCVVFNVLCVFLVHMMMCTVCMRMIILMQQWVVVCMSVHFVYGRNELVAGSVLWWLCWWLIRCIVFLPTQLGRLGILWDWGWGWGWGWAWGNWVTRAGLIIPMPVTACPLRQFMEAVMSVVIHRALVGTTGAIPKASTNGLGS